MCDKCGCGDKHHHHDSTDHGRHYHEGTGWHSHDSDSHHGHDHSHNHDHDHDSHEKRTITVEEKVLSQNDREAEKNRKWLKERGVIAMNIISSPGSGKTYLLERTLDRLNGVLKCAVITGDVLTDNDAKRLEGRGAKVCQIETHGACHLDASQIARVLPEVIEKDTKILFIENIGNLVCPSAFNLGEEFKIALLSVTEGEDKPVKYPELFTRAQTAVITKTDLIPHLDWNLSKCKKYIHQVNPRIHIFELSAKTGDGMEQWLDYLRKLVINGK